MAYMSMNLTLTDLNNKFDKIASIHVVIIKSAIFDIMTMLQMTHKIFVNHTKGLQSLNTTTVARAAISCHAPLVIDICAWSVSWILVRHACNGWP